MKYFCKKGKLFTNISHPKPIWRPFFCATQKGKLSRISHVLFYIVYNESEWRRRPSSSKMDKKVPLNDHKLSQSIVESTPWEKHLFHFCDLTAPVPIHFHFCTWKKSHYYILPNISIWIPQKKLMSLLQGSWMRIFYFSWSMSLKVRTCTSYHWYSLIKYRLTETHNEIKVFKAVCSRCVRDAQMNGSSQSLWMLDIVDRNVLKIHIHEILWMLEMIVEC